MNEKQACAVARLVAAVLTYWRAPIPNHERAIADALLEVSKSGAPLL